jgi:hypothetical protein
MAETPGEKILDDSIEGDADDWVENPETPPLRQTTAGRGPSDKPLRQRIEEVLERRRLARSLDEDIDDEWLR